MKRLFFGFVGLAVLAMCCNVSCAGDAKASGKTTKAGKAAPRIVSRVDVDPIAKLSPEESREISFAGGRILKHVAQARQAIAKKKHEQAQMHVDQALKLVGIIDNVLPQYKVKTEIKSGKLVYTDEDSIKPAFITLFDELSRRDIISPVLKAKAETKQKAGASKNAGKGKSSSKPIAVVKADLEYTSVKLDFNLTKQVLQIAKAELAKEAHENHLKADAALRVLQSSGVIFEFDEVDLPLEQAADNLKLAEVEMLAGNHDAAKTALHMAADELKKYENQAGENRSKEVKALHEEIGKLTSTLEKGKPTEEQSKKHAGAITKMWQKVSGWFKK